MFNLNKIIQPILILTFKRVLKPSLLFLIKRANTSIDWKDVSKLITTSAVAGVAVNSTANHIVKISWISIFKSLFAASNIAIGSIGVTRTLLVLFSLKRLIKDTIVGNFNPASAINFLLNYNPNISPIVAKVFTEAISPYMSHCVGNPGKFKFLVNSLILIKGFGVFGGLFKFSSYLIRIGTGAFAATLGISWSEYLQTFNYLKEFAAVSKSLIETYLSIDIPDAQPKADTSWLNVAGVILLGITGVLAIIYVGETFKPGLSESLPYGIEIVNSVKNVNIFIANSYDTTLGYFNSSIEWLSNHNPFNRGNVVNANNQPTTIWGTISNYYNSTIDWLSNHNPFRRGDVAAANPPVVAPEAIARVNSGASDTTIRGPLTPPASRPETPLPQMPNDWE